MKSPGFDKYEVGLSTELALKGQSVKFSTRKGERLRDGMIDFRFGYPPAHCSGIAPNSKMGYAVIRTESLYAPTIDLALNISQFTRLLKNPDGEAFVLE